MENDLGKQMAIELLTLTGRIILCGIVGGLFLCALVNWVYIPLLGHDNAIALGFVTGLAVGVLAVIAALAWHMWKAKF